MASIQSAPVQATSALGKPYIAGASDEAGEIDLSEVNQTADGTQADDTVAASTETTASTADDTGPPLDVHVDAVISRHEWSGECDVNWTVTGDDWVETDGDARYKMHITRYRLRERKMRSMFVPQKWILQFENKRNYHYFFTDATNDTYSLNCFLSRTHALNFDSAEPTIKRIQFRK